MNKEQIQEIKARCEAATPGPWFPCEHTYWILAKNPYGKGDMHLADIRGWGHLTGTGACGMDEDVAFKIQKLNGAFIAHARQDIPALLAYIDEVMQKEIPVNIIIETHDDDGIEYDYIHYRCPCCLDIITQEGKEQKVGLYRPKYHQDCGQRLSWEGVNHERKTDFV